MHKAQEYRAQNRRNKSFHAKPRHQRSGNLEHQRIDHDEKRAQSDQGQRECDDLEQESERRVDQPDHHRRDQSSAETSDLDSWHDGRHDGQAYCIQQPVDEQVPHGFRLYSMAQLYTGTSGFAYPGWKPRFYPANLPDKKFLEHYASRLNCVEINYTFRRLPAATTLENWVKSTPASFRFACKANQRITHILRLKDAGAAVELFLRSIDPLRSARRLGPILFQLPPNLKFDITLLTGFLALLPSDLRISIEFRHTSWLQTSVYEALSKQNISLCLAESERLEIPEVITADFVYYRLRKPEYSEEERKLIAERAQQLLSQGKDLYLFFKHEETPEGALYAEELASRL